MSNEKLTCISEITGRPMVAALDESCGESSCADVCEDYGENGCNGCPVQAVISKLYDIEHPQPLTLEQLRERTGSAVWLEPLHDWSKVAPYGMLFFGLEGHSDFHDYGKTWSAYDYPPKEDTDERHEN